MNTLNKPKITVISKFYPPYSGITGEVASELVNYLVTEYSFDAKVVHTDSNYGKKIIEKEALGETHIVKSVDIGKGTFGRLISAFIEGYKLIKKAKKINQGEPIIVLTDPPFLVFFAGLLLRNINWVYWSMDLYPEAYVAAGLVKPKGFLYKIFEKVVYSSFPKHIIALGENQAAYILDKYQKNIQTTVLPASLKQTPIKEKEKPFWYNPSKTHISYCGNMGRAHSPEFIIELVKKLDSNRFSFIFSSFGPKSQIVKEAIKNQPSVYITPKLDIEEMSYIDIHTVSLLPKWTHVCVPSKSLTALNTHGAVLFYGEPESDTWETVKNAAWLINPYKDLTLEIDKFFDNFTTTDLESKKIKAKESAKTIESNKTFSYKLIAQAMKKYYYGENTSKEFALKNRKLHPQGLLSDKIAR